MARGIYKQKGSAYFWIRYVGIDGRIIRESTKTNKFKQAQVILEDRKKAVRDGLQPESIKRIQNYSFTELAGRYKAWIEG